jgi:hypothetical protein
MDAPTYDIGDVVYLRESASLGFLEAVTISGVTYTAQGWAYAILAGRSSPSSIAYYGDRIQHVSSKILYFTESELVSECDALELAETNAQTQLTSLQAQRSSLCDTGTE